MKFYFIPTDHQRRCFKHWIPPSCACTGWVRIPTKSHVTPLWPQESISSGVIGGSVPLESFRETTRSDGTLWRLSGILRTVVTFVTFGCSVQISCLGFIRGPPLHSSCLSDCYLFLLYLFQLRIFKLSVNSWFKSLNALLQIPSNQFHQNSEVWPHPCRSGLTNLSSLYHLMIAGLQL